MRKGDVFFSFGNAIFSDNAIFLIFFLMDLIFFYLSYLVEE